jgi:hypothetical protein
MDQLDAGPVPAGADENQLVKELTNPLFTARGWMRFLGVLTIIYGAISALTIVGILVAWIPIWVGVLLLKAAGDMEMARLNGDKERFLSGLNQIKTLFMLSGIILLIELLIGVIAILIWGTAMMSYVSSMR